MMCFEKPTYHLNELKHAQKENPGQLKPADMTNLNNVRIDDKPLYKSRIEQAIKKMKDGRFGKSDIKEHTRQDFEILFDNVSAHDPVDDRFFEENNVEIIKILSFYLFRTYSDILGYSTRDLSRDREMFKKIRDAIKKDRCANYAYSFLNEYGRYAYRYDDEFTKTFNGFYPVDDKYEIASCMVLMEDFYRKNFNWMDTSGVTDLSYFIITNKHDDSYCICTENQVSYNEMCMKIGEWDVSNVSDITDMFFNFTWHSGETRCFSIDFSKWRLNINCATDTEWVTHAPSLLRHRFNFNLRVH